MLVIDVAPLLGAAPWRNQPPGESRTTSGNSQRRDRLGLGFASCLGSELLGSCYPAQYVICVSEVFLYFATDTASCWAFVEPSSGGDHSVIFSSGGGAARPEAS